MDLLKEVCLQIAQEALKPPHLFDKSSHTLVASLENLNKILSETSSLSPTAAEYVFFPLRSLLQQEKLSDRVTELLLRAIAYLCIHSWNKPGSFELERAQQLLAVTSYLLSPSSEPDAHKYFQKPIGYRSAAFSCLHSILIASCTSKFASELGRSPAIADVIMLLLSCLQHDSENTESQIDCLQALTLIFNDVIINQTHRTMVLPKVASKVTKFIGVGSKRHYKAKVAGIECLGCIFVSTYKNFDDNERAQISPTTLSHLKACISVVKRLQITLLEVTESRPELQDAIFTFGKQIYELNLNDECSQIGTSMLLLTSSQSINPQIAEAAQVFLKECISHQDLERELATNLKEVPSLLQTPNETRSVVGFEILKKQIELLDDESTTSNAILLLASIERSLPIKIKKGSSQFLAQQAKSSNPIREIQIYDDDTSFISLNSIGVEFDMPEQSTAALADLLSSFGSQSTQRLTEYLVSRLEDIKTNRANITLDSITLLWELSCILMRKKTVDCYDIVNYCFEGISISNISREISPISAAHTALCCFVIGEAALIEGSNFSEFLVDLVHPMFALLGNFDSVAVRRQASIAISKIALACGYASSSHLAIDCKDYLVDGISFQLNTLNISPGTFQALSSLIYISGSNIIPYLDDVFASLFILLDKYHKYTTLLKGVLGVFASITEVVRKTVELPKPIMHKDIGTVNTFKDLINELEKAPEVEFSYKEEEATSTHSKQGVSYEDFKAINDKRIAYESETGKKKEADNENQLDQPDEAVEAWNCPVPKSTYTMVAKIAGYCDRLMTHEIAEIRYATLAVVTPLLPYLALSKDLFLPLVHKLWPEATARVLDKEAYVVEQAFECINAISVNAQDFVTVRIGELWPKLEAKYSRIIAQKWPQFSPEQKISQSIARFLQTTIQFVPGVALETYESAFILFRPPLLRTEFHSLRDTIVNSRQDLNDLLWLVLLNVPEQKDGLPVIQPVYKA